MESGPSEILTSQQNTLNEEPANRIPTAVELDLDPVRANAALEIMSRRQRVAYWMRHGYIKEFFKEIF